MERLCGWCGTSFESRRFKRYCTPECFAEHRSERHRAQMREKYHKYREQQLAYKAERWRTDPEYRARHIADCERRMQNPEYRTKKNAQQRVISKRFYHQHREDIAERRHRRWVSMPPEQRERYRQKYRIYRRANQARYTELVRQWRRNNPERAKEFHRNWLAKHPEYWSTKSVIRRLRTYGHGPVECVDRKAIIARDNSTCYLCGKVLAPNEVTLDHVIPISRNGTHSAANLKVACRPCNSRKHARLLKELDLQQSFLR